MFSDARDGCLLTVVASDQTAIIGEIDRRLGEGWHLACTDIAPEDSPVMALGGGDGGKVMLMFTRYPQANPLARAIMRAIERARDSAPTGDGAVHNPA